MLEGDIGYGFTNRNNPTFNTTQHKLFSFTQLQLPTEISFFNIHIFKFPLLPLFVLLSPLSSCVPICSPCQLSLSVETEWQGWALWFQVEFKLLELYVSMCLCVCVLMYVCKPKHFSSMLFPAMSFCHRILWAECQSLCEWELEVHLPLQEVFAGPTRALINTHTLTNRAADMCSHSENFMSTQEWVLCSYDLFCVCVSVNESPSLVLQSVPNSLLITSRSGGSYVLWWHSHSLGPHHSAGLQVTVDQSARSQRSALM